MRALGVGALALLVMVTGCYSPAIPSGAFICGPGGLCPSGFTCQNQHCVNGTAAPPDLSVGDLRIADQASAGDMALHTFYGSCTFPAYNLTGFPGILLCFDTETGAVTYATPDDAGDPLTCFDAHTSLIAAGSAGWQHFTPANGPAVALWNLTSLSLPATGTIGVTSNSKSVLALAACGSLALDGTINLIADGALGGQAIGAPGQVRNTPTSAAPGGGGGGADGGGGGGGGYSKAGAMGKGTSGGAGQAAYGTAMLSVVYEGSGGGAGGGTGAGLGGSGGGAVALLGHSISVNQVYVDGGPGRSVGGTATAAGGGGGGSGGSILISGDEVNFDTTYVLSTQGGLAGNGIGTGSNGGPGAPGRVAVYVPLAGLTVDTGAPLTATPVTPFAATQPLTTFPSP